LSSLHSPRLVASLADRSHSLARTCFNVQFGLWDDSAVVSTS